MRLSYAGPFITPTARGRSSRAGLCRWLRVVSANFSELESRGDVTLDGVEVREVVASA